MTKEEFEIKTAKKMKLSLEGFYAWEKENGIITEKCDCEEKQDWHLDTEEK